MKTQLFVPKKCKVGFNLREDTYTGKLGYVIAWDGKKWRKEPSWESWRDKPEDSKGGRWVKGHYVESKEKFGDVVKPIEFDNVPISGFVLNKKVGGYKTHWNARQTYSRVYDPRGFEFEINIANLLYILQHANCMKGKGLEGDFIYAWDGKDLVLLPAEAPEFESAVNFTKLQGKKFSARDLKPGCSYKTKKEEDVIYIGRYMWYNLEWYGKSMSRAGKKYHIFWRKLDKDEIRWNYSPFFTKSDASFIAQENSDKPVNNFAELVDEFKKLPEASDITKFELVPVKPDLDTTVQKPGYRKRLKRESYFIKQNNDSSVITECKIFIDDTYDHSVGYYYNVYKSFNIETKQGIWDYSRPNYDYNYYRISHNSVERSKIEEMELFDLYITYENGKRVRVEDLETL